MLGLSTERFCARSSASLISSFCPYVDGLPAKLLSPATAARSASSASSSISWRRSSSLICIARCSNSSSIFCDEEIVVELPQLSCSAVARWGLSPTQIGVLGDLGVNLTSALILVTFHGIAIESAKIANDGNRPFARFYALQRPTTLSTCHQSLLELLEWQRPRQGQAIPSSTVNGVSLSAW